MSAPVSIAHYRVVAELGEGGMGEVWRATDTRLNRDVAIKILPESFAADDDRLARFGREAQVVASLNHPSIAAIYGVEERALVMELVEGQTLAERIARGPIPLDDALLVARQIAEALEYAHGRGVIHRDLKPANIKVTPEGRVKVLDFGLAKAVSTEAPVGEPASSATLTIRGSLSGMILGTAAYMAPEQARGQGGRFARRHLVVRCGALRDANGPSAVRGSNDFRYARNGTENGTGFERSPGRGTPRHRAVPSQGLATSVAVHR